MSPFHRIMAVILMCSIFITGCTPSYTFVRDREPGMNEFPITEFNATFEHSDEVVIYLVSGQSLRAHYLMVEKDSLRCIDTNAKRWQIPLSSIDRLEENSSAIGCVIGTGYGALASIAIIAISALTGFDETGQSATKGLPDGVLATLLLAFTALVASSIAGGSIGHTVEYRIEAE